MGIIGGDKRMEGILFYWLFWIGWIMTTFFYPKKHPDRLKVSAWILIVNHFINIIIYKWMGLK